MDKNLFYLKLNKINNIMRDGYLLFHIEWHRCYKNSKEFNLILENNSLINIHITKKGNIDGPCIKELKEKLSLSIFKNDIVLIGEIDDIPIYFYNYSLNTDMNEDEDGYIHDSPPMIQKFNDYGSLRINYESKDLDNLSERAIDTLYIFLKKFGRNILEIFCKSL